MTGDIEITCAVHDCKLDIHAQGDDYIVAHPCPRCYYRVSDSRSLAERMTAVAAELQSMQLDMEGDPMRCGMACEVATGLEQIGRWTSELAYLEADAEQGKDGAE
jgi:hypothetical protein